MHAPVRQLLLDSVVLRLVLWLCLAALALATIYQSATQEVISALLNAGAVVDEHRIHKWGVLVLCAGGLFLKRSEIQRELRAGTDLQYMLAGAGCIGVSYMLFQPASALAGALGLFLALFGRAARWPAVFLALYVASVSFPQLVESAVAAPVANAAITPTTDLLQALGYPITRSGLSLVIIDTAGRYIYTSVTAACASPTTLAIFLTIFAIMVLDVRPSWRAVGGLFLFGLAGTWVQNLGRLIYLMLTGHYYGEVAMWQAHNDSGYQIFLLWYTTFALIFFTVAKRERAPESARVATEAIG